jgi:hypothetical protein
LTSKWIEVDPQAVNLPRTTKLDGVEVTVMMSPYDVPQALRGEYEEKNKRFVIEFRYLGEEDTRDELYNEHVTLRLGKHSGRLYGIELDVDAMNASWVQLVTTALLDTESRLGQRRPRRPENYALAGQLLQRNAPVLSSAMAG